MEQFFVDHKSELLATVITIIVLLVLKLVADKTIRKIGRMSDIVEARTLLITKYASILHTLIGFGVIAFIWGGEF